MVNVLIKCKREECENTFIKKKGKVYCSNYCSKTVWNKSHQRKGYVNKKVICAICSVAFITKSGKYEKKYCSNICSKNAFLRQNNDSRIRNKTRVNNWFREMRNKKNTGLNSVYCVGFQLSKSQWYAKIGYTGNTYFTERRFRAIQTGCPFKLKIISFQTFLCSKKRAVEWEKSFQNLYPKTPSGNEWVVIPKHEINEISKHFGISKYMK